MQSLKFFIGILLGTAIARSIIDGDALGAFATIGALVVVIVYMVFMEWDKFNANSK